MDVFFEIGLLVIFAGIGTYLAGLFRQPLIPAYILSGMVLGNFLGIITNQEVIAKLSEIGIAFLLFIVGLEFEFKKLKEVGKASVVTTAFQMVFVVLAGYLLMRIAGLAYYDSIYLGLAAAFSSTMLVVKILSDRSEINTLHGRIIIGVLVMQDVFAIAALAYFTSFTSLGYSFILMVIFVLLGGVGLSKLIFPQVFAFAARSRELLLCVSLSVLFLFALLFQSIGLSLSIGAFFAGVLLANLPYRTDIIGRVKPLRDFFAVLFFTSLGLQVTFSGFTGYLLPLLLLVLVVFTAKPLVTYLALRMFSYKGRVAFISSASLAQISEFSLILVAQGVAAGLLSREIFSLSVFLAIITMAATSYLFDTESRIYSLFKNIISVQHAEAEKKKCDVLLCGHDRIGYSILKHLRTAGKTVTVIDFNPDVIKKLDASGVPCIYGDFCDPEVLDKIDVSAAKAVISTSSNYDDNLFLLQKVRESNPAASVVVTAHKIDQALELYDLGADYVILPHFLGGDMVASMLSERELSGFKSPLVRFRHINDLVARRDAGHEHPVGV